MDLKFRDLLPAPPEIRNRVLNAFRSVALDIHYRMGAIRQKESGHIIITMPQGVGATLGQLYAVQDLLAAHNMTVSPFGNGKLYLELWGLK